MAKDNETWGKKSFNCPKIIIPIKVLKFNPPFVRWSHLDNANDHNQEPPARFLQYNFMWFYCSWVSQTNWQPIGKLLYIISIGYNTDNYVPVFWHICAPGTFSGIYQEIHAYISAGPKVCPFFQDAPKNRSFAKKYLGWVTGA